MFKKKFIWFLITIWIVSYSGLALAKISRIKITEARDLGIKIAIYQDNLKNNIELGKINEIIANDLDYSGQFKVLLLDRNPVNSQDLNTKLPTNKLSNFDFKYWRDLGVEYLLVTKLYPANDAKNLIISLQLLDLYKPLEPINLNKEIIKYPNENLRNIAHKISDLVFQNLIGIQSFFKTKIAYIRAEKLGSTVPEYSLNIADFDGVNEHRLFLANYPLMSPKWSPDGKKIAFVSFKGNRSSINVIDLQQKKLATIAKYPGINGAPAWSPSGEQLAIVLSKDGNPAIYILNLVKNELRRLTKGIGIDTEPYWSNDGQEIFFTSNRGGKPQIYKINLHSERISRVTFKGEYNATPILTPDNRYLVMLHCYENCSKKNSEFKIALQSLETGKVKVLTKTGMEDTPTLSPNGMMVMYSTRVNKDSDLVLASVNIEGSFCKYLPIIGSGSLKSPTWSANLE